MNYYCRIEKQTLLTQTESIRQLTYRMKDCNVVVRFLVLSLLVSPSVCEIAELFNPSISLITLSLSSYLQFLNAISIANPSLNIYLHAKKMDMKFKINKG